MAAEFDLLLDCLQMAFLPKKRPFLTIQPPCQWSLFLALAERHAVAPFLFDLVQQGRVTALPMEVKAHLWAHYRLSHQQNEIIAQEVIAVVSALRDAGVMAVPLKGVALAAAVYGNLAQRQAGDIDLWVSSTDLAVCMAQLQARGYVEKRPFRDVQEQIWRQISYEQTWGHPKKRFVIDLHWALTPSRLNIPFEPTAPLVVQSLANGQVQLFSPVDQLLYLCLHGFKHGWYRLSWIVDVACLLRAHPDLNWGDVFAQAKRLHIQRIVRLGIYLAQQLLAVSISPCVQIWLDEDKALGSLMYDIYRQFNQSDFQPLTHYSWQEHRYLMAGRERLRDRIRFTARRMFTLSERDLNAYPFSFHTLFLYQAIRPFRFLYHLLLPHKRK